MRQSSGFTVIETSEEAYPEGLKRVLGNHPLWVLGNRDLLTYPAVGICGSRNASVHGLKWAREFGREVALAGVVVISGYARGVDREAHQGALEAGGATIAVLPEGMNHFRVVKQLKDVIDLRENFLAVSLYEPDAPWTAWRAMARNRLIVGLSAVLFVIEARNRGGTMDAALEAKRQGKPLWVAAYPDERPEQEGNRKLLLEASAVPVRSKRDIIQALTEANFDVTTEVKQLVLSLSESKR